MTEVRVQVFHEEQHDGRFPFNGTLKEVLDALSTIYLNIPTKYQGSAKCEISTDGYHDSSYATITISYWRPQTEAEIKSELAKKTFREEQRRKNDIETLAALKAKYE